MTKRKDLLIALLVMLLWGSMFPVIRICCLKYDINTTGDLLCFAGIRFTESGIIMLIYAMKKDAVSKFSLRKNAPLIFLASLFAVILQNLFTYPALNMTGSSEAAILKQSAVLLYVGFSFLIFKDDKPTLPKFIGVILGFGGIVVINYTSGRININAGNMLMVCASFSIVVSNIIYKILFKKIPPLTVASVPQLFGGVVLLILGLASGGAVDFLRYSSLPLISYLGAATAVSYALWYGMVGKAMLSKLFIIKFSEPIFSCIFAAMFLNENIMTIRHLLSFLLIFSGIYIKQIMSNFL